MAIVDSSNNANFESWPKHYDGRLLCSPEKPKPANAPLVNWVHNATPKVLDDGERFQLVCCPCCGSEWTRSK